MSRRIFISYRRDDAKAEARSIYQHLARVYGREHIFMDVDSIQKGLDFVKVLDRSLEQTSVMIVVMGRTWLSLVNENGQRRLDDPADFVRMEIASALKRDIPVIPVRVDGARLPRTEELPADLHSLVRRQGTVITHDNFDSDVVGLERDLMKLVKPEVRSAGILPVAIGSFALLAVAAAGAGWWMSRPVGVTSGNVVPAHQSRIVKEAAATQSEADVSRQRLEERERREADVRRRIESEMEAEARRKADAARMAAETEARLQAEETARRKLEQARIEAEAEALRKAVDEQERARRELEAKAEAERARAEQARLQRSAEIAAAWTNAKSVNTLQAYLAYLNRHPDAPNKEEARDLARPLLVASLEASIDARLTGRKRPDGTLSFYERFADNPRAAALCIDWKVSSAHNLWISAVGMSGLGRVTPVAEREETALAMCRSRRAEGSDCTCEIVRRNHESTLKVPADWMARQLD